jgi:EAL domain-containing protein (putative c-di-GMP-specific phosphodiesterase class I)
VPLSQIDFEITETSIEDYLLIWKQMLRLQEKGAEFSLDDFGTGTSNLIRLLNLPIHIVKLDMYIVQSYFSGKTGILPDMVRMFHNAHVGVIAEGIETADMKEELARIGCDYQQGYFYSRPVPPEEFVAYLETVQLS